MSVNHFLQFGIGVGERPEQDMLDSILEEQIKAMGHDFVYVPRTLVKEDNLFGEDVLSAFEKYYTIEMYITNATAYEGNGDLLSKFGLDITDQMTLTCSRNRFQDETGMDLPREGDLIWFPLGKALWQIDRLEDQNPFYQLSKQFLFEIHCSLFTFSQETFETGHEDVDKIAEFFGVDEEGIVSDVQGDNATIDEEADRVIDWSENDPFSAGI